jgi:hypothetical protein
MKFWLKIKDFLKTKKIETKETKKTLPIKHYFSGLEYKKWGLISVDFYPFAKNDFATEILKLYLILKDNKSKEILDQAIDFSRSTIILNKKGEFQRVFFASEKDLKNFLINYKQEND